MTALAASVVPVPSTVDRVVKLARLAEVLRRHGADSIVLRSHTALAWVLDGARTHVSLAGDVEVLTADPRWPSVRVDGLDRPIELDRVRFG